MKEEERIGEEVATLLEHSLNDISPDTLHRLQLARKAALENCQPAEKMLPAGMNISIHGKQHWFSAHGNRLLLSTMLLLILVTGLYWKSNNESEEKASVDTLILTDDAPAETGDLAVDDEFDSWLDSTR